MQGMILYEGPSAIDGKPIVVIATGLRDGARNSKTGPMVQIYILRADIDPMKAVQTGDDVSICGACRHRGRIESDQLEKRRNVERSCYVVLMHGPRIVYDAYKRGVYGLVPPGQARKILRGARVRLGAYGDPAAIPFDLLSIVLDRVKDLTGYTHSWRERPALSAFCMASCDTPEEREEAKSLGFRTFRVRPKDHPPLVGEGQCPNALDKTVQCNRCLLCGGNRKPAKADISIEIHGPGATHFSRAFA